MKNKEEHIKALYGKTNPFRVPEGYFEGLSSNIMDKLPEQKAPVVSRRLMFIRPLLYAACFIAVIFTIVLLFEKNNIIEEQNDSTSVATVTNTTSTDIYSEDFVDYAMMDNMDIYACLASDTN